uniref:Putative mucin/peritrophin-like protein n=1 Tax=Rhipicephalus microplus TaxID=6941 RepID=A0A6G4ZXG2_RHIMP
MVNSKVVVKGVAVVAVVVMVVVSVVVPVVQGKPKASSGGPAAGAPDFSKFLGPPLPSEDCVGVVAAPGAAALVADPNDCTKYSVCSETFSSKFDCPPGQHFSPADNRCATPEEAKCDPAFADNDAADDEAINVDVKSVAVDVVDDANVNVDAANIVATDV